MATLALSVAGAAIGSTLLPTGVAVLGTTISGAVIGSQIGALAIPSTGADEFLLAATEYFVREETHGNVAYGFQRLTGIIPAKENKS